jgi:hypothetical protein
VISPLPDIILSLSLLPALTTTTPPHAHAPAHTTHLDHHRHPRAAQDHRHLAIYNREASLNPSPNPSPNLAIVIATSWFWLGSTRLVFFSFPPPFIAEPTMATTPPRYKLRALLRLHMRGDRRIFSLAYRCSHQKTKTRLVVSLRSFTQPYAFFRTLTNSHSLTISSFTRFISGCINYTDRLLNQQLQSNVHY